MSTMMEIMKESQWVFMHRIADILARKQRGQHPTPDEFADLVSAGFSCLFYMYIKVPAVHPTCDAMWALVEEMRELDTPEKEYEFFEKLYPLVCQAVQLTLGAK